MEKQFLNKITAAMLPLGIGIASVQPLGAYTNRPSYLASGHTASQLSTQPSAVTPRYLSKDVYLNSNYQDLTKPSILAEELTLNRSTPERAISQPSVQLISDVELKALSPVTELVIIDAAVPDKQTFYKKNKPGVEIVEIQFNQNGLAQLTDVLGNYQNLDALHLVTHADNGVIYLGKTKVTEQLLKQEIKTLSAIDHSLKDGADLLFYGCNLASGAAGESLLQMIANQAHIDVAASNDLTGSDKLKGDWELEISTGSIETEQPFSVVALKDFTELLVASDGVKNFTGWTGTNTYTLSTTDFNLTGSDDQGAETINLYGSAAYMVEAGSATAASMFLQADGTNTASFQLTALQFSEYAIDQGVTNVYIRGYVSGGGTVTSSTITGTGGADVFSFAAGQLATFSGLQLTGFKVFFDSNQVDYSQLDSFTITGALEPNATPTVTGTPTNITVTEDIATDVNLSAVTFTDTDGDPLTATLTANAGTLAATLGGGVTVGGSGTGTITLAGTAASINTFLDTTTNVKYTTSSNDNTARNIAVKVNDGTIDSAISNITVNITAVNDEPTMTATGSSPSFIEGGAAVGIYSSSFISTFEVGQNISELILTVTNVAGTGADERLVVDGSNVALSNGSNGVTVSNSFDYSVTLAAGTATVTLTKTTTTANWQTLIDGLTYQNVATGIDNSSRIVTITSVKDDGGIANGGDDTNAALSISSTIASIPKPTITSATYDAITGSLVVTASGIVVSGGLDIDASTLTFTGEGGAAYSLTDTIDVDQDSATQFTLTLSAADKAAVNLIINKNGTSSTSGTSYNLAAADDWNSGFTTGDSSDTTNAITVSNVLVPAITSANYDAATGVLAVTGTNLLKLSGVTNDIDVSKFTITGEGADTYNLTTASVEITSDSLFSVTLNSTDKAAVNQILNKNGTSATDTTTYNLAAAEDWAAGADAAVNVIDETGNGITVSNVPTPIISSATYDATTGVLAVTGTGMLKSFGATNDIDVTKLSFLGEGSTSYILTTADVEITSGTAFSVTLNATDKDAVNQIMNKDGTSATDTTTYNLAAAEDWAVGADAAVNVVDATGNGITVINVPAPAITSATYDYNSNLLVVTAAGLVSNTGAANDIDISQLTFTGKNGGTYTLTSASDVEITSGTQFSITLSGADLFNVEALLNSNGTTSEDGTTFNLNAAEDWAAGADIAVNVVDTTNGITVSNYTAPAITSTTYDWNTGQLVITGSNLVNQIGSANDIDASLFTFTGEGGNYLLTDSTDAEISSATSATLTLSSTDQLNVRGLLNKNGASSSSATTYNLAAAEDWMTGSPTSVNVVDLSNAVTVSNVCTPRITSAVYDPDTGVVNVTATCLFKKLGANNDIDISQFTFTGGTGNQTYTITSASDVEITSATSFSFILVGADRVSVDALLDQIGGTSSSGSTYNIAAADNWLAAADPATNIADAVGNVIVTINPTITSATYNASTGLLIVTGSNIQANGGGSDIDALAFTVTGESAATYTLTDTAGVERDSTTQFTLILSATDKINVNALLNNTGASSYDGTVYNLAASDDWDTNVTFGNTSDNLASIAVTNIAPTLTGLNGDSVSFSIGASWVNLDLDADATVADISSLDFDSGNITVAIVANGQVAEDILQIGNFGAISTSGSNVVHSDGFTIGTFTGGSGGANLVISLNANATLARVQDLVRALQYTDSDAGTINTLTRTIRITLDDGDGGSSTSSNQDVSVLLVRAPIIDLDADDSSGAVSGGYNGSFTENAGAVITADSDSAISDDGTFKILTITLTNRPDGVAESLSSTFGVGAQIVNSEAVTITAYDSGTGVLAITVDDLSTSALTMELLMESIQYNNTSESPNTADRSVSFVATDNADNTGLASTATISVISVADIPSVTDASTDEDIQTTTGLVLSRNGVDGTEVTHFKITGIFNGSLFKNDGTTAIVNNDFITFAEGNAGLKFTPTANSSSNGSFNVQAGTNGLGGGLSASSATATISVNAVNDLGVATITGTVTEGQVIIAGIIDADGISTSIFTYQWKRGGVDIAGATANTYTLVQADVGSGITVTVSYIDDQSTAESVTSPATAAVTNSNDAPVANTQNLSAVEDIALIITLTANDVNADPLTYSVVINPSNGILSGTAPDLTYTPNANYVGSDSFTFKANDGTLDSNIASISITVLGDLDGDGDPDVTDPDDDGDGIPDSVEGNGDSDGDGIPDSRDTDSDNDGIPDSEEGTGDSDGDGTADYLDTSIDEDNDGIPDIVEGTGDNDSDGLANFLDPDSDNDGLTDTTESEVIGIDSDSDGIDDAFDVGLTGGNDANNDGIDDDIVAQDTDNDGLADRFDLDSDNDGIPDVIEAFLTAQDSDSDGIDDVVDVDLTGGVDIDGDGIDDAFDVSISNGIDADSDGIDDKLLPQSDRDNDGTPDYFDRDSDSDGISDTVEAGLSGIDSDTDGIDDRFDVDTTFGNDFNNDGIDDDVSVVDSDSDGIPDLHDLDSDNDSLFDVSEAGVLDVDANALADLPVSLVTDPLDSDNDNVADFRDLDSDGDGMDDIDTGAYSALDSNDDGRVDLTTDVDGDGIDDSYDTLPNQHGVVGIDLDQDNDGIADVTEGAVDSDGDGIANYLDRDSDNDGLSDAFETDRPVPLGTDSDNDGIDDAYDVDVTGGVDANGDGVDDQFIEVDTDNDSLADYLDTDSDNDGISDTEEQLLISLTGFDTDGDGIDDAVDVDLTGGSDVNMDGIDDSLLNLDDFDNDGILNFRDLDSDNDSILDSQEGSTDHDGDGMPNYLDLDSDGDGITDEVEGTVDSDSDGTPDYLDTDSDNDGVSDTDENGDFNGDGINDRLQANEQIITVSGSGSMGGLLLLMFAGMILIRRRPNPSLIAIVLISSSSLSFQSQADEHCSFGSLLESGNCWYWGSGIGISDLQPSINNTSWRISDGNDLALKALVGFNFDSHAFLELSYHDLGEVQFDNSNPNITETFGIDYSAFGLNLGYWMYEQSKPWNFYVKAGISLIDTETNQYVEQDQTSSFSLGLGSQYRINDDWAARLDFISYHKDIKAVSASIIKAF